MAKTTLTIKVQNDLLGQFKEELNKKIGRVARETVIAMKPLVNKAVDRAIEKNKSDFIPTDDEAHELGVGSDGSLDRDKIDQAYRGMLTAANNGVTSTETKATPGTGLGTVGLIKAQVNFQVLFKTDLAQVLATNNKKSQELINIPWLEWLLEGQTIQSWHFEPGIVRDHSRTGKGIMNPGGLWKFPPARLGAGKRLDDSILKEVSEVAEDIIQKNINKAR